MTDADRTWVRERLDEGVRQADEGASETNREAARIRRDNPRFTDPKHWWSRPIVDDRGFLWLWLHNARDLPDEADRWVVVSPDGEYLGRTTTPGWAQPHRGYLLTVLEDTTSGERIPTVYRIRPAVEGLTY